MCIRDSFSPAIGRTVSHHRQHRDFDVGAALLQGLDHPQGNQVFPMAVAQDQQAARHPVTDTIRHWEFAPKRRHGQVVRQRIANPLPPVRIWVRDNEGRLLIAQRLLLEAQGVGEESRQLLDVLLEAVKEEEMYLGDD